MIRYAIVVLWLLTLIIQGGCASPQRRTASTQTTYYSGQPGNAYTTYETQGVAAPGPTQQQLAQQAKMKEILKQGALGAATGAIAAEASGGKAGKGALIGAGTNVAGNLIYDVLTRPQTAAPSSQSYHAPATNFSPNNSQTKVIRKYDDQGRIISEEEISQ